eukprot:CAMPEP_0114489780 /NCGR_PEP_ID=MMETSP0109-20121206/2077_1 /TAXON_ID=29199 /ORGANISM="Chlorarachnion reptans, Strain CCCM449" /LENGTH=636 /DNA_ID=CAMNT_0001666325 /DNA_START=1 /DNA_END=1908 /DNA_ORIENTATION=-
MHSGMQHPGHDPANPNRPPSKRCSMVSAGNEARKGKRHRPNAGAGTGTEAKAGTSTETRTRAAAPNGRQSKERNIVFPLKAVSGLLNDFCGVSPTEDASIFMSAALTEVATVLLSRARDCGTLSNNCSEDSGTSSPSRVIINPKMVVQTLKDVPDLKEMLMKQKLSKSQSTVYHHGSSKTVGCENNSVKDTDDTILVLKKNVVSTAEAFRRALGEGSFKYSQAFPSMVLIDGNVGCGKTTLAKLLSKMINVSKFRTGAQTFLEIEECLPISEHCADKEPSEFRFAHMVAKATQLSVRMQRYRQISRKRRSNLDFCGILDVSPISLASTLSLAKASSAITARQHKQFSESQQIWFNRYVPEHCAIVLIDTEPITCVTNIARRNAVFQDRMESANPNPQTSPTKSDRGYLQELDDAIFNQTISQLRVDDSDGDNVNPGSDACQTEQIQLDTNARSPASEDGKIKDETNEGHKSTKLQDGNPCNAPQICIALESDFTCKQMARCPICSSNEVELDPNDGSPRILRMLQIEPKSRLMNGHAGTVHMRSIDGDHQTKRITGEDIIRFAGCRKHCLGKGDAKGQLTVAQRSNNSAKAIVEYKSGEDILKAYIALVQIRKQSMCPQTQNFSKNLEVRIPLKCW